MKLRTLVLGGMMLVPMAAMAADDIHYTYFEIGYANVDVDDGLDGDGFFLGGSAAIHDNWHIFLDYTDADLDSGIFDIDTNQLDIGLGYNVPVADTADFVASLAYKRFEAGNADESGFQVAGGFRAQLAPQFEGAAMLQYWDVDDLDNTSLLLRGMWEFNEQFSLLGEGDFGNELTEFRLGVRVNF